MATFDDAALSKLTAKIDNKLAESRRIAPGSGPRIEPGNKKRKQATDRAPPEPLPNKRSRNEEKRGRKPADQGYPAKSNKGTQNTKDTKAKNTIGSDVEVLLNEIKALGGSEEDLRLVENIDSGDEDGDLAGNDKDLGDELRTELAQFAAGLGFENVTADFTCAESESEELGDELQDEGSDDVGDGALVLDNSERAVASLPPDSEDKSRGSFKGKTVSKILAIPTVPEATEKLY